MSSGWRSVNCRIRSAARAAGASAAGGSEGLAPLKRSYKRRDHIFLQSATASSDPIRLFPNRRTGAADCDTVKVQGVVTMVLKGN